MLSHTPWPPLCTTPYLICRGFLVLWFQGCTAVAAADAHILLFDIQSGIHCDSRFGIGWHIRWSTRFESCRRLRSARRSIGDCIAQSDLRDSAGCIDLKFGGEKRKF